MTTSGVPGVPGVPGMTVSDVPGEPGYDRHREADLNWLNCTGTSWRDAALMLAGFNVSGTCNVISICAPLSSRTSFADVTWTYGTATAGITSAKLPAVVPGGKVVTFCGPGKATT